MVCLFTYCLLWGIRGNGRPLQLILNYKKSLSPYGLEVLRCSATSHCNTSIKISGGAIYSQKDYLFKQYIEIEFFTKSRYLPFNSDCHWSDWHVKLLNLGCNLHNNVSCKFILFIVCDYDHLLAFGTSSFCCHNNKMGSFGLTSGPCWMYCNNIRWRCIKNWPFSQWHWIR